MRPQPPDQEGAEPVNSLTVPLDPELGPTPPPWDGTNRVSLLVMGLDYRDWQAGEGPPRTDTMILFTVDPINRTAGMLSIPRDLWVNIPGLRVWPHQHGLPARRGLSNPRRWTGVGSPDGGGAAGRPGRLLCPGRLRDVCALHR